MKTINVIAVLRGKSLDPTFLPLKLTFPDFKYDRETLENIIQRIDYKAVGYDYKYPIISMFENEHSKTLRDSMDWSKAAELKLDIEGEFSIWEWESLFDCRRVRELEAKFAENEYDAEKYVKKCKNIDWLGWTDEELLLSPVYMFNYALKVCKGRLPDHLDSAMNMESFKNPDSKYVKRYFKTKRYRIRSGKSLRRKPAQV